MFDSERCSVIIRTFTRGGPGRVRPEKQPLEPDQDSRRKERQSLRRKVIGRHGIKDPDINRFLPERFFVFVLTAEIAENAEMTDREKLDSITDTIIGCAIEVHRALR